MTPELWQRLKPLFHAALDCGIEDRAAFIDEACGDDAELKENLERLIQAAQEGTRTFDGPVVRLFPANVARFSLGEVILGRFRIVRPIGSGGMGEVYEAKDLQLGRVALKTIRDGIASSPSAFDRFRREVQLARKVSGAQVCRIHELYLLPASGNQSATAFLTMEYLDGITLSERLKTDGPIPLKEALRVTLDICEGLRLVHEKGVIHRDLKSANIMLCGQGDSLRAVLMDFGLARDFSSDDSSAQTVAKVGTQVGTLPGTIMGTPAYMAPEQFEGKPVSPATDIYALGIVLYELVTGLHPYAAPTPVAAAIRRAHHPAPPSSIIHSVPRKWDRVIQRCLQYEPTDRFQSAEEVAKALRAGPANLNNLRQDRPWLVRLACALVLAVFAWGIFAWWQNRQYYHPGPEALRWYNAGLSAMREGNYVKATNLLKRAIGVDQHFVMAHARLAEASYNLDFQGSAQQELLIAVPERRRLPPLDAMYLNAISLTVMGDFAKAVQDYGGILGRLPEPEKSSGYVDLGMAYERAGDVPHALESYAKAAAPGADNPAAYMDTGVLQSRLHRVAEADKAFDQAHDIFKTEDNREGLAGLDYERGYAANENGDLAAAREILLRTLVEAGDISSVQLETRALSQLSSVEYYSSNDDKAIDYANRVIRNSRDYGLEYWSAEGLMRLGNAYMDKALIDEGDAAKEDLANAETSLQESRRLARLNLHPRIEADADFGLASLRDQEGKYRDQQIAFAKDALKYYRNLGFVTEAADSSVLVVRGEDGNGDFGQALDDGKEVLRLARITNSELSIEHAEEALGSVSLDLEDYPTALAHFEEALSASRLAHDAEAYQALHCADALWRLGRYHETEDILASIPAKDAKPTDIASGIERTWAQMQLSQGQPLEALARSTRALQAFPMMAKQKIADFIRVRALAEAQLGQLKRAQRDADELTAMAKAEADEGMVADAELVEADISIRGHLPDKAISLAEAANQYFAGKGKKESEWLSLLFGAEACNESGNAEAGAKETKQAVDIQNELEHNWGSLVFHEYAARPDYQLAAKELAKLSKN